MRLIVAFVFVCLCLSVYFYKLGQTRGFEEGLEAGQPSIDLAKKETKDADK